MEVLNFHTVPWMKKTKCYPVLSLVPTYSTFTAPNKRMALPLPPPVSIISLRTDREHISINQNFKKEKRGFILCRDPLFNSNSEIHQNKSNTKCARLKLKKNTLNHNQSIPKKVINSQTQELHSGHLSHGRPGTY